MIRKGLKITKPNMATIFPNISFSGGINTLNGTTNRMPPYADFGFETATPIKPKKKRGHVHNPDAEGVCRIKSCKKKIPLEEHVKLYKEKMGIDSSDYASEAVDRGHIWVQQTPTGSILKGISTTQGSTTTASVKAIDKAINSGINKYLNIVKEKMKEIPF